MTPRAFTSIAMSFCMRCLNRTNILFIISEQPCQNTLELKRSFKWATEQCRRRGKSNSWQKLNVGSQKATCSQPALKYKYPRIYKFLISTINCQKQTLFVSFFIGFQIAFFLQCAIPFHFLSHPDHKEVKEDSLFSPLWLPDSKDVPSFRLIWFSAWLIAHSMYNFNKTYYVAVENHGNTVNWNIISKSNIGNGWLFFVLFKIFIRKQCNTIQQEKQLKLGKFRFENYKLKNAVFTNT